MGKHNGVSLARERLDVLDGLRGCAVLLVVWYHIWLVSGQGAGPLTFIAQAGYLGVDLFFFISGFCLYYPYARAARGGTATPDIGHFFERRAMKIVPSYVIALVAFAIVYRAQFASPGDAVWQLVAHLTFIHPLDQATFGSISGPLWTIGIEVQFYLLFPLIVIGFMRSPVIGYLALALGAEAYRWTIGALGLDTSFWWINQLPAVIDLFAAGMLGAHAFVALRARSHAVDPRRATLVAVGAWCCALAGLGYASVSGSADPEMAHAWFNAHRFAIGPLCLLLAVSTFFAVPRVRSIVAARALVFFSTISYNLYLWHLEVMVWVHNAVGSPLWTLVLSLPCAVAIALLFTYAVERPLLRTNLEAIVRAIRVRVAAVWWTRQERLAYRQRG
jgi:peptidoglycan/LPS O-acetylase OafA/YrhL